MASWDPFECVDYYIIRVKRIDKSLLDLEKKADTENYKKSEYLGEGSGETTTSFELATDDEDYDMEESSGKIKSDKEEESFMNPILTQNTASTELISTGAEDRETYYSDVELIENASGEVSSGMGSTTMTYYGSDNEDYEGSFDGSARKLSTPFIDYDDEDYQESGSGNSYIQVTTPTTFIIDDEDYAEKVEGSMDYPLIRSRNDSDEEIILAVEDLEYYEDDYSGDNLQDIYTNTGWRRRRRSIFGDYMADSSEDNIQLILASGEEDYYDFDQDDKAHTFQSIEALLGLDGNDDVAEDDLPHKSIKVETSSGEIEGLDPCSSYKLDVQAFYPENIVINSKEEQFHTLCQNDCDISKLDFNAYLEEGTKINLEMENEPDCVLEYAFKICHNHNCEANKISKSTNSRLTLSGIFKSCLDYELYLLPLTVKTKEKVLDDETNWNASIKKSLFFNSSFDPPSKPENSIVEQSSSEIILNWDKPNDCVESYSITIYEIRHLPNLLPKYVDKETEPIFHHIKLSSDESSLSVTNLSGCTLYKAEIQSIYSTDNQG